MSQGRREPGMDAARGMAMVLMTSTHSLRVVHPANVPELGQWLLRVEPVTPMLFFLIAGWSLARSLRNATGIGAWRKRHLLRGLLLWLLSVALFFLYSGPQWPEILVSNGVLGCLGASIAVGALLGPSKAACAALLSGLVGTWLGLERNGIRIDGLNNGTFPLLPYLPVFLLCFLAEDLLRRRIWPQFLAGIGMAGILVLSLRPGFRALWEDWGITTTFQEYVRTPFHQVNGVAMVRDMVHGLPTIAYRAGFWAPRPALVPVAVALAGLCALFLSAVAERFTGRLRPLALLGRHALPYYVGHLVLLGVLSWLVPAGLCSATWTWFAATAVVVAAGVGASRLMESHPPRGAAS